MKMRCEERMNCCNSRLWVQTVNAAYAWENPPAGQCHFIFSADPIRDDGAAVVAIVLAGITQQQFEGCGTLKEVDLRGQQS